MSISIECDERGCRNNAELICQDHIDEQLENARKEGYDEGFEAGQKAVEPQE